MEHRKVQHHVVIRLLELCDLQYNKHMDQVIWSRSLFW